MWTVEAASAHGHLAGGNFVGSRHYNASRAEELALWHDVR
jgi:hypothetical protein